MPEASLIADAVTVPTLIALENVGQASSAPAVADDRASRSDSVESAMHAGSAVASTVARTQAWCVEWANFMRAPCAMRVPRCDNVELAAKTRQGARCCCQPGVD